MLHRGRHPVSGPLFLGAGIVDTTADVRKWEVTETVTGEAEGKVFLASGPFLSKYGRSLPFRMTVPLSLCSCLENGKDRTDLTALSGGF